MNEKEAIPPIHAVRPGEERDSRPEDDGVREIALPTEEGSVARFRTTILRRPQWMIALLITLAAVWFHLSFRLYAGGLWRDEVNTINVATRHSLGEMANDS